MLIKKAKPTPVVAFFSLLPRALTKASPKIMGTALKSIQDKLALEANDFQTLQKGEKVCASRIPRPPSHNTRAGGLVGGGGACFFFLDCVLADPSSFSPLLPLDTQI